MAAPLTAAVSTTNRNANDMHIVPKFRFLKYIGKGTFGNIFTATVDGDRQNRIFAIKMLPRVQHDYNISKEIDILKKVRDLPYVVQFYAELWTSTNAFIVMNFVQGGDMFSYIQEHGKVELGQARIWAAELGYTINQLHEMNIIYTDLKIENVMIDAKGHIVLTDFGLSAVLRPPYKAYQRSGTFHYMAPEMFSTDTNADRAGYSFQIDWWAFGVVIYEMLTGEQLYDISVSHPENYIYEKLMERLHVSGVADKIGDNDAADLIYRFNNKNPSLRLGDPFSDVKNHPFFKSIIWSDLKNRKAPVVYVPPVTDATDCRHFDTFFTEKDISHQPMLDETLTLRRPTIVAAEDHSFIKNERIDQTPMVFEVPEPPAPPYDDDNNDVSVLRQTDDSVLRQTDNSGLRQTDVSALRQTDVSAMQQINNSALRQTDDSVRQQPENLTHLQKPRASSSFIRQHCPYQAMVLVEKLKVPQPNAVNQNIQLQETAPTPVSRQRGQTHPTTIFDSAESASHESLPLFVKENSAGHIEGGVMKVLDKGGYVRLDEAKVLKWVQKRMKNLVKNCAVPEETRSFNIKLKLKTTKSGRILKKVRKPYSSTLEE